MAPDGATDPGEGDGKAGDGKRGALGAVVTGVFMIVASGAGTVKRLLRKG